MRTTAIVKRKKDSGYTLIELAIVILIVGVMMGAFFAVYDTYLDNKKIIQTETSLSRLTAVIGNFRAQYGRYPCPASLTAPRTSAQYGREAPDLCIDETQVAIGTCDLADPLKGYCVERSARQIDTDNNGTLDTYPRVRRGSIPFRNLNIAEEFTYDGHGNRINYVVTERQAVADTFKVDGGGINIVDDTVPPQPLLFTSNSGHFLIISPGENNSGAYNNNGVLVQACPNPATTAEGKNCDTEANRSEYVQTGIRTSNNATRFDDRLSFYSQVELSLWERMGTTLPDRNNIRQRPDGFVGVNDEDPDDIAAVEGTIEAQDKIFTSELCDQTGSTSAGNCFAPALIGGSGMDCLAAGEFMTGISQGAPKCNVPVMPCGPNELLAGINVDGTLNCRLKGCAAGPYTFCGGVTDMLPSGADGDTTIGPTSGVTFTCNITSWVPASTPAACCVPGSSTITVPCPSGFTGGPSIVTTTTTCSPPATTTTTDDSACNCVGGPVTKDLGCPSGFSGTKIVNGTRQCPSGNIVWDGATVDNCIPLPAAICSLQPINQTGVVTASKMPKPAAGASCPCGSKNASCFTVSIPGISYNKHNCRCSVN